MQRTKWIVDSDNKKIGTFSDLEAAVSFVRQEIIGQIEEDQGGYEDWLFENDLEDDDDTREDYIRDMINELDEQLEKLRYRINEEPKPRIVGKKNRPNTIVSISPAKPSLRKGELEWGKVYLFSETPDYS